MLLTAVFSYLIMSFVDSSNCLLTLVGRQLAASVGLWNQSAKSTSPVKAYCDSLGEKGFCRIRCFGLRSYPFHFHYVYFL